MSFALPSLQVADLPDCGGEKGTFSDAVFDLTHSQFLTCSSDWLVAKPAVILLIIIIALIVRALALRAVRRLVNRTSAGPSHQLLRPLRRGGPGKLLQGSSLASARRQQRAETIGSVLRSLTTVVIFTIAFVEILAELGVNLAPIIASAGIVGVAVGFGAQNLVRDFLTGIFMILEDQYGVGDVIDAGPATGVVEAVGLRTTRLRSVDGTVWHVRNGEISRVGNESQGWSRALLDVKVGYGADLDHAAHVIKSVADSVWHDPDFSAKILEEPEVWGVQELAVDGVTIRLVLKTVPLEQWGVARELRRRLKGELDRAGIEIPLPQRTLWLHSKTPDPLSE